MKLKITKKTYYSLGTAACALLLVRAVSVLAGLDMGVLDSFAFGCTGLMLLFLAAVKGTPIKDKQRLFGCFLLLLGSVFFNVPLLHIVFLGLVWPCFAAFEKNRDERLALPFRAVCLGDFLWMGLRILTDLGNLSSLRVPCNVAGLLAVCARLWLCICLYKRERDER